MSLSVRGDAALVRRLDAIAPAHGDYEETILRDWQMRTTQLAKSRAPKRSGTLARSIGPGRLAETSAQVVATAQHAAFVEGGTQPHVIRPRDRKVLAWNTDPAAYRLSGALRAGFAPNVFAKEVKHPGTRAQPFLEPSARQALDEADLAGAVVTAWNGAA